MHIPSNPSHTVQQQITHISNMITISLCDSYTSCSCITPEWLTACLMISISVIISSLQLTARLRFLRNLAAYTQPVFLSVHFLTTANLPLYKQNFHDFSTLLMIMIKPFCGFKINLLRVLLTCLVLVQCHNSPLLGLFWWAFPLQYTKIAASYAPHADKHLDCLQLPYAAMITQKTQTCGHNVALVTTAREFKNVITFENCYFLVSESNLC